MHLDDLIAQSRKLETQGDIAQANALLAQAVSQTEREFGPNDVKVGKSYLAWAQFLERQQRFDDAAKTYLLAAELYARVGHEAGNAYAMENVVRMRHSIGQQLHAPETTIETR